MMIAKAINMFLKKKRKGEKLKDFEEKRSAVINIALNRNKNENENENEAIKRFICKTYDRLYNDVCYTERPNLTSN